MLWALMSRQSTIEEKRVALRWKIEQGCCGARDLGEEASVRLLGGGRWGDLGH
jgi:predicted methyltransferase MtxX (methanogen marker protein 4)